MEMVEALAEAERARQSQVQAAAAAKQDEPFGADYVEPSRAVKTRAAVAELARRRIEALRLYEPLVDQARFHACHSRMRLLRGSNRGGKTLPAAVEVARAVCGMDPHNKYPKENGRAFCIGKDLRHIGEVMWPKLARAGAFKMLRDEITGEWRAFRPWSEEDRAREKQAKRAPPLIPARLIKEIAWENKKESVPSVVRLHNGWELSFWSSLGKPPNGSDIDIFWLDEEILDPEWYPEMSARILDREGRGFWSATPQAGTDQLFELHERAEKQEGNPKADVSEFLILLANNPHIKEEAKAALSADLTEEERQVRVGGEFALLSYKVYPTFTMHLHGVDAHEIPTDWTRYMVVDPGYQVCAVLFAAVPPPTEGEHIVLYDELYLEGCDAAKFGDAVRQKTMGGTFESFVIDPNMGAHSELGTGKTVARQYADALKARGVTSNTTGSGFQLGSDDLDAGILAVRALLNIRPDGTTRLRVMRGKLPNFEKEIKRYHRLRVNGIVTDKPNQRKLNHLMDDLRYLALFNPRWVKPRLGKGPAGGAVTAFRHKRDRQRQQQGGSFVNLGPGVGGAHAHR